VPVHGSNNCMIRQPSSVATGLCYCRSFLIGRLWMIPLPPFDSAEPLLLMSSPGFGQTGALEVHHVFHAFDIGCKGHCRQQHVAKLQFPKETARWIAAT